MGFFNSLMSYLRSFRLSELIMYFGVQSWPSDPTNEYLSDVSTDQIQQAMDVDPTDKTSNSLQSSTYFDALSCPAEVTDKCICDVLPEQIQRAMNWNPTEETTNQPRISCANSLPSSLELDEFVFVDAHVEKIEKTKLNSSNSAVLKPINATI